MLPCRPAAAVMAAAANVAAAPTTGTVTGAGIGPTSARDIGTSVCDSQWLGAVCPTRVEKREADQ